jgi:hypothetical protein
MRARRWGAAAPLASIVPSQSSRATSLGAALSTCSTTERTWHGGLSTELLQDSSTVAAILASLFVAGWGALELGRRDDASRMQRWDVSPPSRVRSFGLPVTSCEHRTAENLPVYGSSSDPILSLPTESEDGIPLSDIYLRPIPRIPSKDNDLTDETSCLSRSVRAFGTSMASTSEAYVTTRGSRRMNDRHETGRQGEDEEAEAPHLATSNKSIKSENGANGKVGEEVPAATRRSATYIERVETLKSRKRPSSSSAVTSGSGSSNSSVTTQKMYFYRTSQLQTQKADKVCLLAAPSSKELGSDIAHLLGVTASTMDVGTFREKTESQHGSLRLAFASPLDDLFLLLPYLLRRDLCRWRDRRPAPGERPGEARVRGQFDHLQQLHHGAAADHHGAPQGQRQEDHRGRPLLWCVRNDAYHTCAIRTLDGPIFLFVASSSFHFVYPCIYSQATAGRTRES